MTNQNNDQDLKIVRDPSRFVSVGSDFEFWLNEEDDVYDELYRETKERPQTG